MKLVGTLPNERGASCYIRTARPADHRYSIFRSKRRRNSGGLERSIQVSPRYDSRVPPSMRTNTSSNLHLQPDLRKGKRERRGRGTERSTAASQASFVCIRPKFRSDPSCSREQDIASIQEDHQTKFYKEYHKVAEEYDKEFLKKYDEDLNTTLIFVSPHIMLA